MSNKIVKNIIIDVDTEREHKYIFGKSSESVIPTNESEVKEAVNIDIVCMIEALITLISLSASNGYGNKETYIAAVESAINDFKGDINDTK
jgi:hypothetical protein